MQIFNCSPAVPDQSSQTSKPGVTITRIYCSADYNLCQNFQTNHIRTKNIDTNILLIELK